MGGIILKNGIIGEKEEAMIVAGAEGRSFSDMRNDLPRFMKRLVAENARIKGMLIIRRSFICQGIDCVKEENDLITIDELCDILKIGRSTSYHLLQNHEIACFKIGRIWKIPRASVNKYIVSKAKVIPE